MAAECSSPELRSSSQSASRTQRPEVQLVQFLVVHIAITRNWPSRLSQESTPVGAATFRFVQSKLVITDLSRSCRNRLSAESHLSYEEVEVTMWLNTSSAVLVSNDSSRPEHEWLVK